LAVAGARSVVALDPSPAMIERAKARFSHDRVEFRVAHVERMDPENAFDVAVSSMVVHFVPDLPAFLAAAWRILRPGGVFVFSQRHPVRTCNPSHVSVPHDPSWQVANYFEESYRDYTWLEERVRLYHRTFETILGNLWTAGFSVDSVREPRPTLPYVQTSDRLREAELIPMVLACRCSKLRQPERPKLLALTAQVLRHLRSTAKPRS